MRQNYYNSGNVIPQSRATRRATLREQLKHIQNSAHIHDPITANSMLKETDSMLGGETKDLSGRDQIGLPLPNLKIGLGKPFVPKLNIGQIAFENPTLGLTRSSKRAEVTRSASTRSTRMSGAFSSSLDFIFGHNMGIYIILYIYI